MEKIEKLIKTAEDQFAAITEETNKFTNKENKAAATRARTSSMSLIKTLKELRVEILNQRKNI